MEDEGPRSPRQPDGRQMPRPRRGRGGSGRYSRWAGDLFFQNGVDGEKEKWEPTLAASHRMALRRIAGWGQGFGHTWREKPAVAMTHPGRMWLGEYK